MARQRLARAKWVPTVKIKPIATESRRSFLIRSCDANGWPTLVNFANRLGAAAPTLRSAPVAELAGWFGIEPGEAQMLADVWPPGGSVYDGHPFGLDQTSQHVRKVCQACLHTEAFGRFWWEFNFITSCPDHGLLEERCQCGAALSWGDRELGCCPKCEPAPLGGQGRSRKVLPFEAYCLGRLGVTKAIGNELLDELPIAGAARLIERLATLDQSGFSRYQPQLTGDAVERSAKMERVYALVTSRRLEDILESSVLSATTQLGPAGLKVPADALGWFAAHLPTAGLAPKLNTEFERAIGVLLGHPVTDLFRNDFVEVSRAAQMLRRPVQDLIADLREKDELQGCYSVGESLFLPVSLFVEKRFNHRSG